MGLRPDWPNVGIVSLAHSYGFSKPGASVVVAWDPINPRRVPHSGGAAASDCERAGGDPGAVPALWRIWHEANAIGQNIHLAISAGAPLPVQLEQSVFARHGLKIHNFYGKQRMRWHCL